MIEIEQAIGEEGFVPAFSEPDYRFVVRSRRPPVEKPRFGENQGAR